MINSKFLIKIKARAIDKAGEEEASLNDGLLIIVTEAVISRVTNFVAVSLIIMAERQDFG